MSTILLADDQVPCDNAFDNDRVKEEIRREFSIVRPGLDVDAAFADDHKWFSGLLDYLEGSKGETVVCVRNFGEAEARINDPRGLDVAIVDLSWWGDDTLPHGARHRHNRGLRLLPAVQDKRVARVPIICLSQNFANDFDLMSTVLERGALPIPKNYREPQLGYRALYAAVQYLARGRRRSKVEVFVSHAHEDKDLADRLVTAIQVGLQVPTDAIRCTSVAGYGITPGQDFIEALKDELTGASCVIGLWTPHSAKSQWCLFELGAAWGLTQRALFLSVGTDSARNPPAGFQSMQVSELGDAKQLREVLDALAHITGWKENNRRAADSKLDDLAQMAKGIGW